MPKKLLRDSNSLILLLSTCFLYACSDENNVLIETSNDEVSSAIEIAKSPNDRREYR
jgi:hypothetical protein